MTKLKQLALILFLGLSTITPAFAVPWPYPFPNASNITYESSHTPDIDIQVDDPSETRSIHIRLMNHNIDVPLSGIRVHYNSVVLMTEDMYQLFSSTNPPRNLIVGNFEAPGTLAIEPDGTMWFWENTHSAMFNLFTNFSNYLGFSMLMSFNPGLEAYAVQLYFGPISKP